jgi:hypothetical protein
VCVGVWWWKVWVRVVGSGWGEDILGECGGLGVGVGFWEYVCNVWSLGI